MGDDQSCSKEDSCSSEPELFSTKGEVIMESLHEGSCIVSVTTEGCDLQSFRVFVTSWDRVLLIIGVSERVELCNMLRWGWVNRGEEALKLVLGEGDGSSRSRGWCSPEGSEFGLQSCEVLLKLLEILNGSHGDDRDGLIRALGRS